jgi:ubiquinone biosynthesis protein
VPSRSRHIALVLGRHALRGLSHFSAVRRREAFARELRLAFQELGPAFVKLGQVFSVRPDVFGPELVFELEKLQDRIPALPASAIRAVVEREFGAAPEEVFASFEDQPLASASIAQVHRATLAREYRPVVGGVLPAGTALAVKVVRPGGEEAILADIAAARPLAMWLGRMSRFARYNLPELLDEFAATLRSECDLRREARVADRFAFDFRDDDLMVVPRVVWPRTSRRVLTTEYVEGWRLSDLGEASARGVDGRMLAEHGARVFLRQVLEIGRFHADLHPANLFVTPDGRICYLDFGITGTTSPAQRRAIAQVLAATVHGDAGRALRYSAELGLVVPEARQRAVREKVAALMSRTLSTPPRDIRGFAMGFLRIMDDERVEIPVGYGLLVKALVTVEGVARALYPDIDITQAAGPYATRMVARWAMQPAVLAQRMPRAVEAALRELAG